MASGVRVKINMAGVRELFNDPKVTAELKRRAEAIKAEADSLMPDGGYTQTEHHKVKEGRTSIGTKSMLVVTNTNEAKAMQAKHSTLTKAIDAGRG